MTLSITNDGQRIVATNYWSTPHAAKGLLYLSINAGAARVLVPPATGYLLLTLPPVGTQVVLRRPRGRAGDYLIELRDDPARPYVIEIDVRQADRLFAHTDAGRTIPLIWYVQGTGEACREARRESVTLEVA